MVRDITERKLAEAEIAKRLEQMRAHRDDLLLILNGLGIGAALADESGVCVFLTAAAGNWLENTDDIVGKSRCDDLPVFGPREKRLLREMAARPASQRTRVAAAWEGRGGRQFWMDVEIQDDPTSPERKIYLFHDVTELHDLRRQLDGRGSFENLVGRSKPMVEVYWLIDELSSVDSTVLIEGETGTGKELVARALHSLGTRKGGPFVALNCAGLTETLVASQLFGHRRGSFTGAVADNRGVFEAANGGVLFLDEIGDIPPAVQTSLLRVLQEREITRIGDTTPRKVDVRVIAATHRDLRDEVAKGNFRTDLLYRVRVARIELPPLRHRKEDLPLLAARFLGEFRAATGKPVAEISLEAMRLMQDYDWPGNVRELRSAIEVAVIRCRRAVIGADDLPGELRSAAKPPPSEAHDPFAGKSEEESIRLAMEQSKGNRSQAAKRLGVSRATFYRRLAQLNISLES
jgi:DNA-binding NtrC family response regulator